MKPKPLSLNDLAANHEFFEVLGEEIADSLVDLDVRIHGEEFLELVRSGTGLSVLAFLLGVIESDIEDELRELTKTAPDGISEELVDSDDENDVEIIDEVAVEPI